MHADSAAVLAERAPGFDEADAFVADNYVLLKEAGLVEAGVPRELGGGGAEVAELCEMLRTLAHACGSTALAFSMHTHQVAIPAWRWRHQKVAAVEPLLRRVAAERLILVSSGGSDWIGGSGTARKVDGGYRISARKVFTSGAPVGDLLMTGAILEGEDGSKSVIHFAAPMKAAEVRVVETWRALGMRGTGSHDVVIEDLFIPDAGVALLARRRQVAPGVPDHRHRRLSRSSTPSISGSRRAPATIAVEVAKRKPPTAHVLNLAGRMDTALRAAQLAHRSMVEAAERNAPSAESVNDVMIGRTLVAEHAIQAVELAMELAGGAAFYRATGLERRFRDVQGARFHPLQQGPQAQYAGAMALGQPVDEIF